MENSLMEKPKLIAFEVGDVVQLDPDKTKNRAFIGCFLVVTEVKEWGIQGYVPVPGAGLAFYRADYGTFEKIGKAVWFASGGDIRRG